MNVPINKNMDDYRDDFFKGLSLRQCIYSVLTLSVGGGAFFVANVMLGIPQMVSVYLTILAATPIAGIGFVKIAEMPVSVYLKKKRELEQMAELYFDSEESVYLEPGGSGLKEVILLKKMQERYQRIRQRLFGKVMLDMPKSISAEEAERWLSD